eukprot:CAMPEP_0119035724 /NCGR_PEP_ID=MMETSP1177-20130426/2932_1 /TAXON_ID=2985 /ORGANISM="Ochromonas sp, Strain CCMP1899" /LENGTH=950 /DNA_ID=CAMNT_0006994419 /DNA_START=142 /DNA_END=2994 /DNA_ORIENTATION=-
MSQSWTSSILTNNKPIPPLSWTSGLKLFGTDESPDDVSETVVKEKSITLPQIGDNSPKLNNLIGIPLSRRPIFPGFLQGVMVKDEKTIEAILRSHDSGVSYLSTFLRTDKDTIIESPELISSLDQIHKVGTFVQIQQHIKTETGLQLLLVGHRRVNLNEVTDFGPPLSVKVDHWDKPSLILESNSLKAYRNEVIQSVVDLFKLNHQANQHYHAQWLGLIKTSDSLKLADFAAHITTADAIELQAVLEASDPEERLSLVLELLSKEKEVAKLQRDIQRQVEEKMAKSQRDYFLREQLKSIKKELGLEKDDKDDMITKYAIKIGEFEERKVDEKILTVLKDEMQKLSSLERNSPEFNVTRSYLDWLTAVPWKVLTEDRLNLKMARETLDADHFGLDEIKKRILEFIAVGKLRGTVAGKIICFIGPPGVGKTSIAKSIASALDRKFYRFSVGGLTDIAEIKGHRRTYIGAMPGKPIQSLKTTGCSNPLILIDEVDKLGRGYNGDPASALLELLDPNQNESFVDHYLDIPVDFSQVLFVCTANDESTIPGPLRDRMEIIRLSGYDIPEKVAIATRYLVPKALKEAGLQTDEGVSVTITEEALNKLVRNYCRESGVRSLEKHIEKIARKIAFNSVEDQEKIDIKTTENHGNQTETVISEIDLNNQKILDTINNLNNFKSGLSDEEKPKIDIEIGTINMEHNSIKDAPTIVHVTVDNLEEYVGKPKFTQDTIYDNNGESLPPGVVMGLAWNPLGGCPVFIETAAIPIAPSEGGGGVNIITGQLGSVMKESVNIAYTYARQFTSKKTPENVFFKGHQLHLHVPEGAVEKDGPSAGVAMTTSLISIALDRPLRPRLAMTGELSLTGKVLPVGGIKEKVLAARRSGADTVILPTGCKADFEELPQYVKDSVTIHFVSDYHQVFDLAFPLTPDVLPDHTPVTFTGHTDDTEDKKYANNSI